MIALKAFQSSNSGTLNAGLGMVQQHSLPRDRDINASQNILAAGQAVSVCGASVRPEESKSRKATALKQKPKS